MPTINFHYTPSLQRKKLRANFLSLSLSLSLLVLTSLNTQIKLTTRIKTNQMIALINSPFDFVIYYHYDMIIRDC